MLSKHMILKIPNTHYLSCQVALGWQITSKSTDVGNPNFDSARPASSFYGHQYYVYAFLQTYMEWQSSGFDSENNLLRFSFLIIQLYAYFVVIAVWNCGYFDDRQRYIRLKDRAICQMARSEFFPAIADSNNRWCKYKGLQYWLLFQVVNKVSN